MKNEPKSTNNSRKFILPIIALVALIVFGFLQWQQRNKYGDKTKNVGVGTECTGRAFAEIGGPFSLIDKDSKPVSDKDFLGKPMLIYFGYTMCPDVCPTSLSLMGAAMEEVEKQEPEIARKIQPIFISIDPTRDTPKLMGEYAASGGFAKGLVGLTGSEEQIKAAARAYKVGYRKADAAKSAANYTMDHTSLIYLVDSKGKLATFFSDGGNPQEMAQCIISLGKKGI